MKNKFYTKKYAAHTRQSDKHGFTILETMVAVFILVLSITGPMVFASSSLRSAFLARDQITAFYLAQDIIESIKNKRDANSINGQDWLNDIFVCADTSAACTIYIDTTDFSANAPIATECTGGVCGPLTLDANGRFTYGDIEESRFTRTTYVREIVDNQEAQVVVEVEWQSNVRIGVKRIIVQENIMNWIPVGDE